MPETIHDIITAYLTAAAPILSAVAWPVAVVLIVLAFRKQIWKALANMDEASWGSAKVKFARAGEEVADSISESAQTVESVPTITGDVDIVPPPLRFLYADRAKQNPLNAILEGYSAIEDWYDTKLGKHGIDVRPNGIKLSALQMTYLSVERGWLPNTITATVQGLTLMRDLAVKRGGARTTVTEAEEYLTLIDGLRYTLAAQFKIEGEK